MCVAPTVAMQGASPRDANCGGSVCVGFRVLRANCGASVCCAEIAVILCASHVRGDSVCFVAMTAILGCFAQRRAMGCFAQVPPLLKDVRMICEQRSVRVCRPLCSCVVVGCMCVCSSRAAQPPKVLADGRCAQGASGTEQEILSTGLLSWLNHVASRSELSYASVIVYGLSLVRRNRVSPRGRVLLDCKTETKACVHCKHGCSVRGAPCCVIWLSG